MEKLVLPAQINSVSKSLEYIEQNLKKAKLNSRDISKAVLVSEESVIQVIEHSNGGDIHIKVKSCYKSAKILISVPGKEFSPFSSELESDLNEYDSSRECESMIRSILLNEYSKIIRYTNKGKNNFMEITAGTPEKAVIFSTLIIFIAAIIIGVILKLLLGTNMLMFVISVIILSLGAPLAPGSILLCMTMLFRQLGISASAICIILGINAFLEMVVTMFDSAGDVAVSLIIAKKKSLLIKIYIIQNRRL